MIELNAHPQLLSAYAVANDGAGDGDPDLQPGIHVRIITGLGTSFPLGPLAVFGLSSYDDLPRRVTAMDPEGNPASEENAVLLGRHGRVDATLLLHDGETEEQHTVKVMLEPSGGVLARAELLDQHGRVLATRTGPPWEFAAPVLHGIRLTGDADTVRISTRTVHLEKTLALSPRDCMGLLGLPLEGEHPWYVGVHARADALLRTTNGAPLRLNPMDQPQGPFDPVGADAEAARVEAMLGGVPPAGLEQLISALAADEENPPWSQVDSTELSPASQDPPRAAQYLKAPRLPMLQLAALDPGVARFAGFGDCYRAIPNPADQDTLAVVGLFAIDPSGFGAYGHKLKALMANPPWYADRLTDLLGETIADRGTDVRRELQDLTGRVRDRGLMVAPFLCFAGVTPPCLPPSVPEPQIIQRHWHHPDPESPAPSNRYRAGMAFPGMPLATMAALAREQDGLLASRHEFLPMEGQAPDHRAAPRIFGHEHETQSRQRELGLEVRGGYGAGLLSDHDIPAEPAPTWFQARAADLFGRFGPPVRFSMTPPPRPAPPPPVLRYRIEPTSTEGPSEGPLSPGTVRLVVAVPTQTRDRFTDAEKQRLSSTTVVPGLLDLPAGALPITRIEISLGETQQVVDTTVPGFHPVDFPLPALDPQQRTTDLDSAEKLGKWTLRARYMDTAGTASLEATASIEAVDRRPPRTYPTGTGLYWTGTPGPSPDVELALRWRAPKDSLHRVYLTDQSGLGMGDAAETVDTRSRAEIAVEGCRNVADGNAGQKEKFTLLTDPPVQAGDHGYAELRQHLPRSLHTVQFLRIVPLGPDGSEPDFTSCGIIPVAVPDTSTPPAPFLDGSVDPTTGKATLRVVAEGLDAAALAHEEPGLYTPGEPGTEPPRFRIRWSVDPVIDPIYARLLPAAPSRPLAPDTPADPRDGEEPVPRFTGATETGPLEPFVRYSFWAEAQMPPERRLPPTLDPAHEPDTGIEPADPQAKQDHTRPWSRPSPPRILMHTPPQLTASPGEAAVTRGTTGPAGLEITLQIPDPPRTHPLAVAPYRIALWAQWDEGPIASLDVPAPGGGTHPQYRAIETGTTTATINIPAGSDPAVSPLRVRMAYIDPLGRMGDTTTVDVP